MSKQLKFKKIRPRMIFWFFTAVLLPLIIVCSIIYYQRTVAMKAEAFHKLTAIRDLKVTQLKNWLQERRGDLGVISRIPAIQQFVDLFAHGEISYKEKSKLEQVRTILKSFVEEYTAYNEIFLINAATGIVEISSDESSQGLNASDSPFYLEPLRTGSYYIRDIYLSRKLKKPAMCFALPLYSKAEKGRKQTAILVSRVDLENSLYTLLLERTGMGKTGETLIVNRDTIALNELKWHEDAPLKLHITAKPAVLASQGNIGVIEALDYRDVGVLASYTFLPETQWGFVAKQDLPEIYAPIRKMLLNMAIILLISGLVAYMLAHMLAMNFSSPILEVTRGAIRIQKGDFSVRCDTKKNDEYGILAGAFNSMAETMQLHNIIQNWLGRFNQILVNSGKLDDFGKNFLQILLEATQSDFGSFFLYSCEDNKFKHLSSIGFHEETMASLNGSVPYEAFNRACMTKKITYTYDLSPDTVFTVNTIAGKALPRCFVTIPILNQDKIFAVIALGSLSNYSEASVHIITLIQTAVGTALSNIIANEKTASLALELQDKNIELKAQAMELQTITQNLKQQNIELDMQSKALEEASRMKSAFLSNMSHELRTPLNSVMALSSVLKMNIHNKLNHEELEYLDVIERNGKRLLDLINNILDLSKIEAGHMDVNLSFFSPKTTIENVVDSLRPLAAKKNLSIHTEIPESLPKLQSDEKRVHQIILNLVDNAVKFTEKGWVSVKASISGNYLCINVADTGIGIDEKHLPSIFEEFKQVDSSTSRRHEGTGLGLAIAHKATKNLWGDLAVESHPGQGTVFTLTLPFSWQGPAYKKDSVPLSKKSQINDIKNTTILVVDDEQEDVNLISDFLSQEGYTPIPAFSGKEALKLARDHNPSAITLDLIMPDMDGLEVLQRLKASPDTMDIPVIIVSMSKDRKTGPVLGAIGHIAKPILREDLLREVNNACYKPVSYTVTDDHDTNTIHETIPPEQSAGRILVVEDNEAALLQIKIILEQEGYIVYPACGGREAKDIVDKIIPDGIILDLMMPDIDGFEVLEKIRSTEDTAEIPVLILTAKDLTPDDFKKLSANNIQQLIQKGDVDREELLLKLKIMLGKKTQTSRGIVSDIQPESDITAVGNLDQEKHRPSFFPESPHILVIEDNPDNLFTLRTILKNKYTLTEAQNGEIGLKTAFHDPPDLILLDISLPGKDGYEIVKELKAHKTVNHIPVIALTAHAMKGDREKVIAAGCNDYLSKPIDPEKILNTIDKWIEGTT